MLAASLGRDRVFYDNWYKAELARPSLDIYLQDIYRKQSELLVVFLSAEYESKEWCGLEWRAIRDLLKSRAHDRVMFLRSDNASVTGLLSIDGYIDIADVSDDDVFEWISARLSMLSAN